MVMVKLIDSPEEYVDESITIAEKLNDYFTVKALKDMRKDIMDSNNLFYVARDSTCILGFIVLRLNIHDHDADILWMAVTPTSKRSGVGTKLLGKAEHGASAQGIERIRVRTLAEEADYEPYNATRCFYEANGFNHILTIPDYPPWREENPCAVYEKEI